MEDAENTGVTRESSGLSRAPLWGPAPGSGAPAPPGPPAAPTYEYPPSADAPTQFVNGPAAPKAARKPLEGKAVVAAMIVSFVVVAAVVVVSYVRGEKQSSEPDVAAAPVPVTSNRYDYPTTTTKPPVRYTTTRPSTSVSTSPFTPAGYRKVTGPNGVFVSIPQTWTVAEGSQPTNHQAGDPATPGNVVRYGASTSEARPLYDAVAANESSVKTGYQRIKLATVSSSAEVVEWEFLYTSEGVQRHAFARYWRRAGLDYIVYGASDASDWTQMQQVVYLVVSSAGPTA